MTQVILSLFVEDFNEKALDLVSAVSDKMLYLFTGPE